MGGPGLGKTHLVVSILKQLILEEEVDGKFVDFFNCYPIFVMDTRMISLKCH